MENVFLKTKSEKHCIFSWEKLGNIKEGRGDLGEEVPVLLYRLLQYTMLDVLSKEFGEEKANHYIRKAGYLAGKEFVRNVLDLDADFNKFIADLQKKLQEFKIGILRIETIDENTGEITLTVAQDLDCSGLPVTDETVCDYDEGFISGILELYTKKPYDVREIDCWASGDRVCRFNCKVVE
ncbi:MAG: 4-vinyl reductase [Fibromonadaceae bacterium]|jgi:predicted hydrocarbon binding protein|nr:4-vinyl reductase [Fibromonadaceae bacterium]